jgi:hypothetical protein
MSAFNDEDLKGAIHTGCPQVRSCLPRDDPPWGAFLDNDEVESSYQSGSKSSLVFLGC